MSSRLALTATRALARFLTLAFVLALASAASGASSRAVPVVVATDIGDDIDDTWALVLALKSPELDVKLVLTDYGDTARRVPIVARLLQVAGRTEIPIGIGVRQEGGPTGQDEWVKGYDLASYPGRVHQDGVQALVDLALASKEPVTLVALGPPPSLAEALRREPRIAGKLRLAGMYGSLRTGYSGKPKPEPEWNVKAERDRGPRPARSTLARGDRDPARHLRPRDAQGERYARLRASKDPLLVALFENYELWCRTKPWCAKEPDRVATRSSTLFDTVAVYLAVARDLVVTEALGVRVTDDGMTLLDPAARPLLWATAWKDLDGYEEWLTRRLLAAPPGRAR